MWGSLLWQTTVTHRLVEFDSLPPGRRGGDKDDVKQAQLDAVAAAVAARRPDRPPVDAAGPAPI
jgi:hypothetical protein